MDRLESAIDKQIREMRNEISLLRDDADFSQSAQVKLDACVAKLRKLMEAKEQIAKVLLKTNQ